MKKIERTAYISHSAEFIYKLVNDIDSYPLFIDGCIDAEVIENTDTFMIASIQIKKAGMQFKFTTKNTLTAPSLIQMTLLDGPFKHFIGRWEFGELNDSGCKVLFCMEFEFDNRNFGLLVSKIFDRIADRLIDDIIRRADQLSKV